MLVFTDEMYEELRRNYSISEINYLTFEAEKIFVDKDIQEAVIEGFASGIRSTIFTFNRGHFKEIEINE